jgi:uncharacterized protein YndB with AHSA1/START domain
VEHVAARANSAPDRTVTQSLLTAPASCRCPEYRGLSVPWCHVTDGQSFSDCCGPTAACFPALVDPAALSVWLPPNKMSGSFERFDARPGGSYRLVLTNADAATAAGKATNDTDIVEARFIEIVPDVRVVQVIDFVSDDPAYAGTMTMTWEVEAAEAGTRVEIRADNVPSGISAEDHAAGLASSLANLAAFLEG